MRQGEIEIKRLPLYDFRFFSDFLGIILGVFVKIVLVLISDHYLIQLVSLVSLLVFLLLLPVNLLISIYLLSFTGYLLVNLLVS